MSKLLLNQNSSKLAKCLRLLKFFILLLDKQKSPRNSSDDQVSHMTHNDNNDNNNNVHNNHSNSINDNNDNNVDSIEQLSQPQSPFMFSPVPS